MIRVEIEKDFKFKEVNELFGHTNFREFEKEYDDLIVYADGHEPSVVEALLEPIDYGSDMSTFNLIANIKLYMFDGWFIAVK